MSDRFWCLSRIHSSELIAVIVDIVQEGFGLLHDFVRDDIAVVSKEEAFAVSIRFLANWNLK